MNFTPSPKSASAIAREARQTKGRNRHLPHQTDALNEVFERTEHPSLQERTELGKRLGMETKVVNSWFQNKRASMRKKAQRAESSPTTAAPSQPPAPIDLPAVPPRSVHPALLPRSEHPSLPPIADLLRASPPGTASSADTDSEDDNMAVQLPPIREDSFTRPAFLSPKLAAVCLPQPLPASAAVPAHQPISSHPSLTPLVGNALVPSLSASRSGSPHSSGSIHYSERLVPSPAAVPAEQWEDNSRPMTDSFPDRHVRRSRAYDPLRLSTRLPPVPWSSEEAPETSPRISVSASIRGQPDQSFQSYSREQSQEVDELMDDSPIASVTSLSYKARRRPSPEQLEELRRTFAVWTHPSRQERERLAQVTGMRMQSISNWFQHQRSMAKRRQSENIYQQPSDHVAPVVSRAASPAVSASISRPRRSRPEPFQLEALKALFAETTTPTMEQRSALALRLGMTDSKITNWFRNARQTAKKKGQSTLRVAAATVDESDDIDDDNQSVVTDTRSSGLLAPAVSPATSSIRLDAITDNKQRLTEARDNHHHTADDMDVDDHYSTSHTGSEDELVTPSPSSSTQPLYASPKSATAVDDAALLLNLRTGTLP